MIFYTIRSVRAIQNPQLAKEVLKNSHTHHVRTNKIVPPLVIIVTSHVWYRYAPLGTTRHYDPEPRQLGMKKSKRDTRRDLLRSIRVTLSPGPSSSGQLTLRRTKNVGYSPRERRRH
jgi:hypothetical protein